MHSAPGRTDSGHGPVRVPLRLRWILARGRARGRQAARAAGVGRRDRYTWQRIGEHRDCWQAAATALGADFLELRPGLWEVRQGTARTRIAGDRVQLDDPVTLAVAGDKELCYHLAEGVGVPVAQHGIFTRHEVAAAWRMVEADGHPFVVKPARGTSAGIGVTVGIRRRSELLDAFALAAIRDERVIVERLVPGETCRLLFLDGVLVDAVRRRGIRLEGDGTRTIRQLLAAAGLPALERDRLSRSTLAAADLTLNSVPPEGARIVARGIHGTGHAVEEVRTVYDETIMPLVSPQLVEEAARIVDAVGATWAGVDVVTSDPSQPLSRQGALLEVNTTPGILHHCGPGPDPCGVAVRVLRRLLAQEG